MIYTIQLTPLENGKVEVSCRDLPECIYEADSRDEAVKLAGQMLPGTMVLEYRKKHRSIPMPTKPQEGDVCIYVPVKVQAKILFWNYIKSKELRMADVAKELGVTFTAVSRYCDLTTDSASVDAIEAALEKLGGHFSLTVR